MINVSKNDFEEGNYDTTGVVLAEGVGEDGVVESYNIYYLTDEKGAASNLRIKKDTKKQDAALAAHNKKHN